MPYDKLYRWKDNKGKERTSKGIVLTDNEKQDLCRKNLALIAEQKAKWASLYPDTLEG
jgi:hypothetical protein